MAESDFPKHTSTRDHGHPHEIPVPDTHSKDDAAHKPEPTHEQKHGRHQEGDSPGEGDVVMKNKTAILAAMTLALLFAFGSSIKSDAKAAGFTFAAFDLAAAQAVDFKADGFKAIDFKAVDFKASDSKTFNTRADEFKVSEFKSFDFKAFDFKSSGFKTFDAKAFDFSA